MVELRGSFVPSPRDTRESRVKSPAGSQPQYELFPGDDCVPWTPWKEWVSGQRFYSPYDIVVSQRVLLTLRDAMAADLDHEMVGLLQGELITCPVTLRRWIKLEDAHEPALRTPIGGNGKSLEQALLPPLAEARGGGVTPIGWYHLCSRSSFALQESEAEIHARYFRRPWQLMLLVLADLQRPAGGLFLRSEAGRMPRKSYRPFFELPEEASRLSDGRTRSFVAWQNYMTDAPVVRAFGPADKSDRWIPGAGIEALPRPSRTGRRVTLLAAATLAVFAGIWALRGRPPLPFLESAPVASKVSEFAAPDGLGGELQTEAAVNPAPAQLYASTLTAFRTAAGLYLERRRLFDEGRIDCVDLAAVYEGSASAFLDLQEAAAAAGLEGQVADEAVADSDEEMQAAEQRMSTIEAHFVASRCPRTG